MAYEVKYRMEFDTIKERSVKLEIEEDRNLILPTGVIAMNYIFDGPSKALSLGGSISSFLSIFEDYIFEAGDKLNVFISPGNVNNGTYTINTYQLFVSELLGEIAVVFLFDESVTAATGTGIEISITAPAVVDLTGYSETPVELNYPNGEFDKMTPIRESRMRIKVLADVVNAEDFYITKETQYKVKLYINNDLHWVGWLDNDYITEPFLDTNVFIELSANDGLSLIKNIPLQDFDGNQIWDNVMSILDYIKYALYQTKLELDFWSFINMYPYDEFNIYPVRQANIGGTWDYDAFYYSFTKSQTFLKGPRDFDDCYEVLSKIMQAFGCTLFQAQGKWYIINMNDRILGVLGGTLRNYNGVAISAITNLYNFVNIDIGLNKATKLINADALTSIEKPFKEVVIKYSFDTPPVYFRNFDLLDGTLLTSTPTLKTYSVLYWGALHTPLTNFYGYVNDGRIRSELDADNGAELIRYLQLQTANVAGAWAKRTTDYLINAGDSIDLSFFVKEDVEGLQNGKCWVYVILYNADTNTNRYLDIDGSWQSAFRSVGYQWVSVEDRRFWKEYAISSQPVPFSGIISVQFTGVSNVGGTHNIFFRDFSFSVNLNANNFVKAAGYEFKSENAGNLKTKYSNEIFISNYKNISSIGVLTNDSALPDPLPNWRYRANQDIILPFAQYVNRGYFRTMYRRYQRIEGRLFDIYQNDLLISPLQNISFDEISQGIFMATTLQIDIRNESAEFTMIEFIGKIKEIEENDRAEIGVESFRYLDVKAKDYDDPIKEPKIPIDYKWGAVGIISSLIRRGKIRRFNNYS